MRLEMGTFPVKDIVFGRTTRYDAGRLTVDRDAVLASLLPRYVEMQVYQGLLESRASEQSARMVAMKNATDSACSRGRSTCGLNMPSIERPMKFDAITKMRIAGATTITIAAILFRRRLPPWASLPAFRNCAILRRTLRKLPPSMAQTKFPSSIRCSITIGGRNSIPVTARAFPPISRRGSNR